MISYEYWRAKNISKAFEEVCGLESLLNNESNQRDNLFSCIEDALKHVVYASKAFLFLEQDMLTEAEKVSIIIKVMWISLRIAAQWMVR